MDSLKNKKYVIVDVETTGSSASFDRVIEIGILRIENGEVVETFNSLVNPQVFVPHFIEKITGINAESLLGAPTFEEIYPKIEKLLQGAIFVAHNARFDYGFIKNELKRSGVSYNSKCLCTVRLSRKMFPRYKRHDLTSIIERFNFKCENRHRAYDDAKVLWDFIKYIEANENKIRFEKVVADILSENTLPQFLNEKSIKSLPEGPGIYIFYGENDEELYIGKSKNIRYRVLSHFSNDHTNPKEMHLCQQTVRVEAQSTAGELSALLLESQMIKDLSPQYNRQLRRVNQLVLAKKSFYEKYPSVTFERVSSVELDEYENILGVFKNIAQAKSFLRSASREVNLCQQVLGLEKGKGMCFYYQIEKCSGACVGKIDPKEFDKKLNGIFNKRKIRGWPFSGPVMIDEKINDHSKHSFVLDNWCLLKDVITTMDDTVINNHTPRFDYDSYKIFRRYFRNPLNKKNITHLNKKDIYTIKMETESAENYVYME